MALRSERYARWGLLLCGILFVAQGGAKALDPGGYAAAFDAFRVLPAFAWVSLGAVALTWTVLELLAGVALLYGAVSRRPARELVLAGVAVALGLAGAYAALYLGAYARDLPVQNSTFFGAYLAHGAPRLMLLQQSCVVALLAWLGSILAKSPSLSPASPDARTFAATSAGRRSRRGSPLQPCRTSARAASRG